MAPSATASLSFSTAATTWSWPSVAIHSSSAGVEEDTEEVTTKRAYPAESPPGMFIRLVGRPRQECHEAPAMNAVTM
jgi:hypothetical protein